MEHKNVLATRGQRFGHRVEHVLSLKRGRLHILEVFRHSVAGGCQAVAVQQACIEEHLHCHRQAANAVELYHIVLYVVGKG
jgi:hypothetical protein